MTSIICPACWHTDTHAGIRNGYEASHDDARCMYWNKASGGARGQQVTPWDLGWWRCPDCDLRLTPEAAATLIDAVLRVSSPDSDSYDPNDHVSEDALAAFKGNDDA
jgi:hypothetical protein